VLVDQDLSVLGETVMRPAPPATDAAPYGAGHAADAVADALLAPRP
jgi:UDP-N-acetylglucosamine 2-epimerase (non-hydrolysing)